MSPIRPPFRLPPRPLRGALALAVALALAGCATFPTEFRPPPPIAAAARPAHNLAVFDRTWELVREKYFDATLRGADWDALRTRYRPEAEAAADDEALYAVVNRLLGELKESHLAALTPRQAHEFRTRHRAAVGMRWRVVEDRRVITEVVPGSPAEAAGVQPGWIPISRDGQPLDQETPFTNAVGRAVTYEFLDRENNLKSRTMTAGLLTFERRESRLLDDGTLYLRFDSFTGAAARWLSGELKRHRDAPAVILDLRQNSGGAAYALRLVLGEFFDESVPTGTTVRRGGRENDWNATRFLSAKYEGHVVVLLDRFSASSSEILAHALRHHGRATLIGRPTASAVIVARFYSLPGGGRLEIPVEDFLGLDGRRLEGTGVTPDIAVPLTLADLRAARDPDLEAALTHLQSVSTPAPQSR